MKNKEAIAQELSKRSILTKKEANIFVEEVFEIIFENLLQGEEVTIVGFGKFYLYEHQPRPVRNPKTQEEMVLGKYKSLRFKPSNIVKGLLKDKTK